MSNPITRLLKGELIKVGCAGVAFVVFSPIFFFTYRPHDDVNYYLLRPEKLDLDPNGEWKPNQFVQVTGRIDPGTFQVHRQGLLGTQTDFKFRLEGYPETLVICVTEGVVHEALYAAYQEDRLRASAVGKPEELETLIHDRFTESVRAKMFGGAELDPSWRHLGEVLAAEVTIEGRLHRSPPSGESAFDTFAASRETRIAKYFDRVLGLDLEGKDWWLIDADERPEPIRFLDANGPMFLVFFCCGVAAAIWFFKRFAGASSGRGPKSGSGRSAPIIRPPPVPELPPSIPPSRNPPPHRGAQWD
ncbi:MAG: hypothetical protein KDN18_12495 [Verrucomicrobiae bacterium]|nr:hypothetical protein [Verrucomicrobiae bacterium]